MDSVVQLITSVGFPIACCIFMGYYIMTTLKEITKTIENNTQAIIELTTLVKQDEDDKK